MKYECLDLTWASFLNDLGSKGVELIIAVHSKRVGAVWIIGDAVEFIDVDTVSDANSDQGDVVLTGLVGGGSGGGGAGRFAVSDDHRYPWNAGTSTACLGEHLLRHVVDGASSVGATAHVVDVVDCRTQVSLVCVHIERELNRRVVAELLDTNMNLVSAHVKLTGDTLQEGFQFVEVCWSNTSTSINKEHDISLRNTCLFLNWRQRSLCELVK